MAKVRLAYLVSHPIQYQAPLLARIAKDPEIDLTVFFCSDISLRPFVDPGFGREIAWDTPLLEGYAHEFLPAFGDKRRLSAFRPLTYGLARRLREGRFDALWVHGYARLANLIAMVNAKRLGLKVLLRDDPWHGARRRGAVKQALKEIFFMGLRQVCDGVLAVGSQNRRYFLDYGFRPERIFSMPWAVDNARYSANVSTAAKTRERFRAELGLEPGRPVLLFVGKLATAKGVDHLLDAYFRVLAEPKALRPYLVYVGEGERHAALKEKASAVDGVRFLGFRNQGELPALYELCDILVLPSFGDTWGLVVNEAMNAGRAIIASDRVGAAADLVRDGDNGLVYPAGDAQALATALIRVLGDEATCRRMGERSLEIISRWGFEEDLAGLKSALQAVLGH